MSDDQAAEGRDVPNPKYDAERAAARERWAAASREERIAGLRAGAKGSYGLEAATELLIRALGGRLLFLMECDDEQFDGVWSFVEWSTVADRTAGMSGGEQRIALIAADLAGFPDEHFELSDVAGLDRDNVALVLAAISHAAGTHEQRDMKALREAAAGNRPMTRAMLTGGERLPPLFPWPEEDA